MKTSENEVENPLETRFDGVEGASGRAQYHEGENGENECIFALFGLGVET